VKGKRLRIPLKYAKHIKQGQKSGGRNCICFCEQEKMQFCCKQNDALPSLSTIIAALTFPEQTLFVSVFLLI